MFRPSLARVLALLVASYGVSTASARGQNTDACMACLDVVPAVQLSSADGPIVPSLVQFVVATADGFLVSHFFRPPQIARYDTEGRLVQLYERRGGGPGEFRSGSIVLVRGTADTVYAFEAGYRRLVRFTATMQHVDTKQVELAIVATGTVLPTGHMVVDQVMPGDDSTTYTVSLINPDGSRLRAVETGVTPVVGWTLVTPSVRGGFWTLRPNDLWLREYSASGAILRSVRIRDETFVPWAERIRQEGFEVRPRPSHVRFADAGDDRLIIVKRVADSKWSPRPPITGMFRPAELDRTGIYDSIVELVDARTGDIIATRRFDELLSTVGGSGRLLYSAKQDELGHVITQIWRVELPAPG